jgi:hypothetical protein
LSASDQAEPVRRPRRGLPARRDRPDQLLRLERRFQLEGLDGLKDLPPIAKSHPMTTPPEVVARIEARFGRLELVEHGLWGDA